MSIAKSSTSLRPTTRNAIIEAAIELLGINPGSSLAEIAIRAGVGRASVHRHFASREALVRVVSLRCMDELEAAVRSSVTSSMDARQRLTAMLDVVIPIGDRFHFLGGVVVDDTDVARRYQAELLWLETLAQDLKTEQLIGADLPTSWVVANINAQIWLAWSEIGAGRLATQGAGALATRTLLNGLAG